MMDCASFPRAVHEDGIQISDFATFQPSSPAAQSPSISRLSSPRHSFGENEHDSSTFDYSSPPPIEIHDEPTDPYGSSTPASEDEGEDLLHDHLAGQSSSSRSSISSLPASVMPDSDLNPNTIPHREQTITRGNFEQRIRGSPFRHTSSVRAMQMNDELTPPSKRRAISTMSELTDRSRASSTSPSKRSICTPQESPTKPQIKKEYPLILLHCKLLPPSLPLPGGLDPTDERLLKDLLPEEYFSRWKVLCDRLGGASSTVKERGILIPHPKEDYDLLEERLLESLELVKPRIKDGHFLGYQHSCDDDSDDETDALAEEGERCPDCGKTLRHTKDGQKWEVKVYAATGLMREGAWGAAWNEMEKVDVEIGVFLPEDVRREIDEKFSEYAFDVMEDSYMNNESEEQRRRRREIYGGMNGSRQASVNHPPAVEEDVCAEEGAEHASERDATAPEETARSAQDTYPRKEPQLQDLLTNYLKLLARDPKNIAIILLVIMALYLACLLPSSVTTPPSVAELTNAPVNAPVNPPVNTPVNTLVNAPVLTAIEYSVPSIVTMTAVSVSTKTEYVLTTALPTVAYAVTPLRVETKEHAASPEPTKETEEHAASPEPAKETEEHAASPEPAKETEEHATPSADPKLEVNRSPSFEERMEL